ncbi:MAG: hypothetical protein GF308_01035 [Candidatus Heimdallarchaeota archaeon]|nr:hypothetical protein [Candidatus Heimdallarchaeota archaeon]
MSKKNNSLTLLFIIIMVFLVGSFLFVSDYPGFSRFIEIGFFLFPVLYFVIKKIIAEVNKRKQKELPEFSPSSEENFALADDPESINEPRDQVSIDNSHSSIIISPDHTARSSPERPLIAYSIEVTDNLPNKISSKTGMGSISDELGKRPSQEQSPMNLFCPSCGDPLGKFEQVCTVCGSTRPVCVICYGSLSSSEQIVRLPCCLHYGHKKHLEEHLTKSGTCPVCQEKITIEVLIPVKTD